VQTGEWLDKDASIGAGIDSYYEYLFKGYILLGEDILLQRFNKHYESIMKFMNQNHGHFMQTVHMHMPYRQSRNYMDALLAFWPGLQVLKGDIKEAVAMHEHLYQIVRKHKFLPEAFLSDHSIYWSNHPLRPEFVESTYYLYKATNDNHYLEVGKQLIEHLENHSRVKCGYAAIADVKTVRHEDRIDSFVFAETFKYLYLLFEDHDKLAIDIDEFLFTTEAHMLPLNLVRRDRQSESESAAGDEKTCPSLKVLFNNDKDAAKRVRQSIYRIINPHEFPSCETTRNNKAKNPFELKTKIAVNYDEGAAPRLKAASFVVGNKEHLSILKRMGISLSVMEDGRVQLVHHANEAASHQDAEHGLIFMSEMLELSKQQNSRLAYGKDDEFRPVAVVAVRQGLGEHVNVYAGPPQFGLVLSQNAMGIFGRLSLSEPVEACGEVHNALQVRGRVVIAKRGGCMFIEKIRRLEAMGALAVIIVDTSESSSFGSSPFFAMSGDGVDNVTIASAFLFTVEAETLMRQLGRNRDLVIYLGNKDLGIMESSFYDSLKRLRAVRHFEDLFDASECRRNDYSDFKPFF